MMHVKKSIFWIHICEDFSVAQGGPANSIPKVSRHLPGLSYYFSYSLNYNALPNLEQNKCFNSYGKLIKFIASKHNDDIRFIFHSVWSLSNIYYLFIALFYKIRFCIWIRGSLKLNTTSKRIYKKIFLRYFMKKSYFIIMSTYLQAKVELDKQFHIKLIVIPNNVQASEKHPMAELRVGNRDIIKIGFFGRVEPHKNIHAVFGLLKDFKNVEIILAGPLQDNDYLDFLKSVAAQKNYKLHYQGVYAVEKKDEFFNEIDVLCCTSLSENFGNVILEALSYGKYVLVNDALYISEYLSPSMMVSLNDKIDLVKWLQNVSLLQRESRIAVINKIEKAAKVGYIKIGDQM
jgi:glycosyltransferase involved in cell wall biosynthesis